MDARFRSVFRSCRIPHAYSAKIVLYRGTEVRGQLIDLALRKPRSLDYPFELWTLKRLQTAFIERTGIHLSDSTIWEWLKEEGLHWERQQSWFREAEKQDEAFVEKRGPS